MCSLNGQRQTLEAERAVLHDERSRLEGGVDALPPQPYTRADDVRNSREGAPLWQLVDFRAALTIPQRAGLEAALEAAGLLDAWLSPDGRLQFGDGDVPLFDTELLARQPRSPSLADWLEADVPANSAVAATVVEHLLSGIACADDDPVDSETWIAADGRFRIGALGGAWTKPEAVYIGYAARAAARARRLTEIFARLARLADELAAVQEGIDQVGKDQNQAAEEWRLAPSDETLRKSHLAAEACRTRMQRPPVNDWPKPQGNIMPASRLCRRRGSGAAADATDLRLPASPADLAGVETALSSYQDAQFNLTQAIHEARLALPEPAKRTDSAKARRMTI